MFTDLSISSSDTGKTVLGLNFIIEQMGEFIHLLFRAHRVFSLSNLNFAGVECYDSASLVLKGPILPPYFFIKENTSFSLSKPGKRRMTRFRMIAGKNERYTSSQSRPNSICSKLIRNSKNVIARKLLIALESTREKKRRLFQHFRADENLKFQV